MSLLERRARCVLLSFVSESVYEIEYEYRCWYCYCYYCFWIDSDSDSFDIGSDRYCIYIHIRLSRNAWDVMQMKVIKANLIWN